MKRSTVSVLGALTLVFASCASVPAQGKKAPDWIFTTPKACLLYTSDAADE